MRCQKINCVLYLMLFASIAIGLVFYFNKASEIKYKVYGNIPIEEKINQLEARIARLEWATYGMVDNEDSER